MSDSYLVIHNVQARGNFGTLLRNAAAFGVRTVLVVGAEKLKTFGNQGTLNHLDLLYFTRLDDAVAWLGERGIELLGVEIVDHAEAIHTHPFRGPTAFMLGNEGSGMTEKQKRACSRFVYIPQYGKATASLNVAVAGGICLHHFGLWSHAEETAREGEKFIVEAPRTKLAAYSDPTPAQAAAIAAKREKRSHVHESVDDISLITNSND